MNKILIEIKIFYKKWGFNILIFLALIITGKITNISKIYIQYYSKK